MKDFKFHRGDHVEDMISGFKGFVTARQDHITQCNRYFVEPRVGEDGKLVDAAWFDEACLKPTGQPRLNLVYPEGEPPG